MFISVYLDICTYRNCSVIVLMNYLFIVRYIRVMLEIYPLTSTYITLFISIPLYDLDDNVYKLNIQKEKKN